MKQVTKPLTSLKGSRLYGKSFSSHLVTLRGLMLSSLVFSTTGYAALSATTANTIQGTKPYLVASHVTDIKSGNDFQLLGVNVDGNQYFTETDIQTKLATSGASSIGGLTPTQLLQTLGTGTGNVSASYKTPIQGTDANDSDGDGNYHLTGTATVGWYYKNGTTETVLSTGDLTKTFCDLAALGRTPYIKISGPVTLITQYGSPNTKVYDTTGATSPISGTLNPVRKFYVGGKGEVCYASPNLTYASGIYTDGDTNKFLPTRGFVPQVNVADNFPTTGSNNLYFYLVIAGIDANAATWTATKTNPSSAGKTQITVSVAKGATASKNNLITYYQNSMVLVTLNGSTGGIAAGSPPVDLPASYKVEGVTSSGDKVSYSFTLSKWYITRNNLGMHSAGLAWCNAFTNYKMVGIIDLTNASNPTVANTMTSNYIRKVGGGVYSEWGAMSTYTGAGYYINHGYFTDTPLGTRYVYLMGDRGSTYDYTGFNTSPGWLAGTYYLGEQNYGVCVSK